jgi:hypothetical protein
MRASVWSALIVSGSLAGCGMQGLMLAGDPAGAAGPPVLASLAPSLAAGLGDEDLPVLELPALEKIPRTMWVGGALYAMVQFSPYVGQLGVLEKYKRADTGAGVGIVAGYRIPVKSTTALGIEFVMDQSAHTSEASDVGATATRILGEARLSMSMDRKLSPFALAGVGIYTLAFDEIDSRYDLSGPGLVIGGGIDFSPKKSFSLRAELDAHFWVAEEEASGGGGLATTLSLVLGAGMNF